MPGENHPWRFIEPEQIIIGSEEPNGSQFLLYPHFKLLEQEAADPISMMNYEFEEEIPKKEERAKTPQEEKKQHNPLNYSKVIASGSNSNCKSSGAKKQIRNRTRKRDKCELASILKKPAKRSCFSFAQYEALNATWEITQSPHITEIRELVHITGLTKEQVKNWFKNRRRLTREKAVKGLIDSDDIEYDDDDDLNEFGSEVIGTQQPPRKFTTVRRRISDSSLNTSNSASSNSNNNNNNKMCPSGSAINSIDASSTATSHSSTYRSTDSDSFKLSEKDKRNKRLNLIKFIPMGVLEECMEDDIKARLSQLVLMYMKKKLDMNKTLLRETAKLKERIVVNPFTQRQLDAMANWAGGFFQEVEDGLNEEKKQKLVFVKSNVVDIWQPVILYGKLTRISLEVAIKDLFHLNGADEAALAETEELTVPGILRYMESHFN